MSADPSPGPRYPALQHRDFRVLWFGLLFASGTMAFQYYAQLWLIYRLTDSALVLGFLGATRGVAMLTFGLYGGALADRMDRRRLLMATSALTLLVNAGIAVLALSGAIVLWQALLLIFIGAATASIDQPVRQALIPELVAREHIANAVALTSVAQMGTFALTPVLAGVVIASVGPGGAYAVSVLGNVAVIVALLSLRYRGRAADAGARRESMRASIGEGIRYVRGNPLVLRVILAMLMMGAFGSAIFSGIIVKYVSEVLYLEPGSYGALASIWGVGSLVTSYWLASMRAMPRRGLIFIVSSIGFGLTFAMFGLVRWLPLAALIYVFNGAAMAGANVTAMAIVQSTVPNEVRGRVMSLFMLNQAVSQLNGITLGAAALFLGVAVVLPAATLFCAIVVAALVLTAPQLRSRYEPGEADWGASDAPGDATPGDPAREPPDGAAPEPAGS